MGSLANCKLTIFKNWAIKRFIAKYDVDLKEAQITDPKQFINFNSFFTRLLEPGKRPIIADANTIACPVDGQISQYGNITQGQIIQAKGINFSVEQLLADTQLQWTPSFMDGQFITLYLSPKDYHRVHMPLTGKLLSIIHVPGKLFSVNPKNAAYIPQLFARNERVVCIFSCEQGFMALILVGAIIVASIETIWTGTVTPSSPHLGLNHWNYQDSQDNSLLLIKGAEMGHFKLGSTVIALFSHTNFQWAPTVSADQHVKLGQLLAIINKPI